VSRAAQVRLVSSELPLKRLSRPQHLLDVVCTAVKADLGGICLLSTEGELVEHMTFGLLAGAEVSACGQALAQYVVRHAVPVNLTDLAAAQPEVGSRLAPRELGPFLSVPLLCHGRHRGALYLARFAGRPAFGARDEELILPVRDWLEQGNLFEESRLLAQLRLLNQVAQAAAGSLDLPAILKVALHELDRQLPLHVCAVWLLENPNAKNPPAEKPANPAKVDFTQLCVGRPSLPVNSAEQANSPRTESDLEEPDGAASGSQPAYLNLAATSCAPHERAKKLGLVPGLRLPVDQTPFAASLDSGQALYADFGRPEERGNPLAEDLASRGACASFAVPLRMGKQIVGILQSVCTRPTGFTNEQIQLLYQVADLIGPAISNCQLFRRLRTAYEELRRTQSQLIQAEKMRALGELAGGMAHDFNNSLCGVLGFLELALNDQPEDSTARGYLEAARTCSLDAAETVRRVQNFARWQRDELATQALDLNELARQTVQLTRHKWESLTHARGTPITVEVLTEATARVAGSAAELREVLTNLVFNAVDAMPHGGRLSVRTWSTATDVFLAVQDTGVGMSDSVLQRLFEPFFTTKGERGNGLGLSVTFGIIQRYGGEIRVESVAGQGATFTVRLPMMAEPVGPDSNPVGSTAGLESGPTTPAAAVNGVRKVSAPLTNSLRILVVEDEESIRRFLTTALTQLGHRPRLTANAHEGLAAFAEERFDVVLTDLGLPGVSGEEVARTVARRSPETPVILLTGWSDQLRDEAQPLEGVARILGKPVKLNTLASALLGVTKS
jgi:signal transduction histidine kinase/CheY-like chemotaxis protein